MWHVLGGECLFCLCGTEEILFCFVKEVNTVNLLHRVKQYLQKKNGYRKSAYFIRSHRSVERQQTQSVYLIVCSGVVDRQAKQPPKRFWCVSNKVKLDGQIALQWLARTRQGDVRRLACPQQNSRLTIGLRDTSQGLYEPMNLSLDEVIQNSVYTIWGFNRAKFILGGSRGNPVVTFSTLNASEGGCQWHRICLSCP